MNTNASQLMTDKPAEPDSGNKLARDLQGVVAVTGVLLKDAASTTGEGLANASMQVKQKLHDAVVLIEEKRVSAIEHAKHTADITEKYVHENPWKAIGISAVIGLALGSLLRRN